MGHLTKPLDSVLIKPAGPDCNSACRYCFYLDKGRLFPEQVVHRMSAAVLEATVKQVMTGGPTNVSFGWQGGEPTLMGVPFFEQALEFERRYGRSGQTVGNGLQTNGLLIDDEWCRLLRAACFLVGLSLDGPRHVHNHYRVSRGGQPTWQRVIDAARRMLDSGVEVNALTVVNEYSARFPREVYALLKETGLVHMQFIPCLEPDPVDAARPAPFSVTPAQFGEFLCTIFDCWRDDFRSGQPTTFVRWFDSVFATYVGVRPPECTLLSECGTYVVIEHNGEVFACDFYVAQAWRLGNVLNSNLADLLNSSRQADFGRRKSALPQACQACRWLVHCRGGCPKERWGQPGAPSLSYFCSAYQQFFAHADAHLRELAEQWQQRQNKPAGLPDAVMSAATAPRLGRNDPCPCGSGRKYKRCCGR
ncbi:MAG: anaerobic sulfatase maturase [Planctomycetes bacterium]|nr:anaerobic sulfatase maturase [Planctomycetota bacterium]